MNRRAAPRRGAEEGAAAVEAAVVMSVLLLLLTGTLEFARALWTYNAMLMAVEEAGRYAMLYAHGSPPACAAQTQALHCPPLSNTPLANCSAWRARQVLSAYRFPGVEVSVREDPTSSPATVTVCVSYSFEFIAPGVLPYGPLGLTNRVTVPLM